MKIFTFIARLLVFILAGNPLYAQKKPVTLSAEQIQSIHRVMQSYDSALSPGAALLVLDRGKIVLQKSYGLKNRETEALVDATTCFRLASLTKQFTAMCVLQLVQAGKLSLEDPVRTYLDSLPAYTEKIKIRNLLTHSSGLVDYEDLIPASQNRQVLDIDCMRLMSKTDHLYFEPGSEYRYSNTGYALLALIVEKISGENFAAYLQRHIFQPLKMKNTLALEAGKTQVPNRALGHSRSSNGWSVTDQSVTSAVLGDGGIYTNVPDMARWIRAICNFQLIPATLQQQAWSRASLSNGKAIDYGFGWHVEDYRGKAHPYHSGSSIGFRNHILLFPDEERAVMILTNRDESDPMEPCKKIMDIIWPN
ncbi:MAG: serine hydrolase domain-containing protein [Chitinophagia bacterium]